MKPILIACSDLHLSLKSPSCRADDDWMEVQARYLRELASIANGLPVVIAGDIFDRWNAPPELLSFAFKHLPRKVFAVPGQHDLPNHRSEEMHRSGYGVLVEAGRITDVRYVMETGRYCLHGFGWDQELKVNRSPLKYLQIAVVHRYVWTINHAYPGATEESHLGVLLPKLKGYDVAVFGDNHKGFLKKLKTGTQVLNCGGFIRRKLDEVDYQPQVGIIYDDGTVATVKLDTSLDRFHPPEKIVRNLEVDMKEFVEQLGHLGEHGMDFREKVKQSLDQMKLPEPVRVLVEQALE